MLSFSDNGSGFDLNGTPIRVYSQKGLGLATMRERTQLAGGTFSIDSRIGGGTCVQASWEL